MRSDLKLRLWLIVLAPIILLIPRGRRLQPRLLRTAAFSALAGLAVAVVAAVLVLVTFDDFDEDAYVLAFFFGPLAAAVTVEAIVASRAFAPRSNRRRIAAVLGALAGHVWWIFCVFLAIDVSSALDQWAAVAAFVILVLFGPGALVGGACAAMAAALVPDRSAS